MSTTNISPVYDLGTRADYLQFGVGAKKSGHQEAGTNRIAPGYYCDAEDIDIFIQWGNHFAEANKRRVKAHSILLNFPPDELDVTNPDDLQRAGDLAFHLAKKAFPNSPCLIVVHDDADGGHVHAHITIVNHDLVTGKAPVKNRTHARIKALNDELMRAEGMRVATVGSRDRWAVRREEKAARIASKQPRRYEEFDLAIGDHISAAKRAALAGDLDKFMDTFTAECKARGVDVEQTEHEVKTDQRKGHKKGDLVHGLRFEMLDEFTPTRRPRSRRRSASKLAHEFTLDGLAADVEQERQRRARDAQADQEARQRAATLTAMATTLPSHQPLDVRPGASFEEQLAAIKQRQAEQQRQLDELKGRTPAADEPNSPLATARDEPSGGATAPTSEGVDQAPPALATARPGPSDVATAPTSERYRSRVRDLPAQGAKIVAARDRWAEFDEDAYARLARGERLVEDRGELKGAKGIGRRDLDSPIGPALHPTVRAELERRVEYLSRAKALHEAGDVEEARRIRSRVSRGFYFDPAPQTARQRAQQMMAEPLLETRHEKGLER